jgi:hypothetical protein
MLLFEFGFHHGAGDVLPRGLDRLFGRHLRVLHQIGNLASLVASKGRRADDERADRQ